MNRGEGWRGHGGAACAIITNFTHSHCSETVTGNINIPTLPPPPSQVIAQQRTDRGAPEA